MPTASCVGGAKGEECLIRKACVAKYILMIFQSLIPVNESNDTLPLISTLNNTFILNSNLSSGLKRLSKKQRISVSILMTM